MVVGGTSCRLDDNTFGSLLTSRRLQESIASCILEHFTNAFSRLCGALEVVLRGNLLRNSGALHETRQVSSGQRFCRNDDIKTHLLWCHWPLADLPKLFYRLRVASQVLLASNEDDRKTLTEMHDLSNPLNRCDISSVNQPSIVKREAAHLLLNVIKRVRAVDGEALEHLPHFLQDQDRRPVSRRVVLGCLRPTPAPPSRAPV